MLSAARGNVSEILEQDTFFYSVDVDFKRLEHQLPMVKSAFKTPPENKIQAVVHALHVEMQYAGAVRRMLSEVDKLIKLYLTIPVTTATAERTFSALKRVKTYLRSSMTQERLNHFFVNKIMI